MRLLTAASAGVILMLALVLSYGRTDHEKELMEALFFECALDGQSIALQPWEDAEEGKYYLFLPSCFCEMGGEFVLRCAGGKYDFQINGTSCRDGEAVLLRDGQELRMEAGGPFGVRYMDKTLQVIASKDLPAVLFWAQSPEGVLGVEEFAGKGYLESGRMVMLDEAGKVLCAEKLPRLKVRGNLTATLDKKPLTFSFDRPIGLLGMAPARKWNLLANATDGAYMRNKIVLDLANESMGGYQPDGEFAEVYLNGVYQGLYLLTEAVETGENRMNDLASPGWYLEMELDFRMEEETPYVITDRGQIFAVVSDSYVPPEQKEQIRFLVNDIESALFAKDGVSLLSGKSLDQLIDLESWAEAFLIQEISGDHDTGIASQFAYIPQGESRLYAGPVWDFDGTMGNVNTPMFQNPRALTASIEQSRPSGNANQNRWFAAMYRNPQFQKVVEEKYGEVFRENLERLISEGIALYAAGIERSAMLDALRWHGERFSWMFTIPQNALVREEGDWTRFDTLDAHVSFVRDFLASKKDFLDSLWVEKRDYCVVEVRNDAPFLNQDYNQTLYYWVPRGEPIEGLPGYEQEGYRFLGYRDRDTGQIVSDGAVIGKDCILEAEWEIEQ